MDNFPETSKLFLFIACISVLAQDYMLSDLALACSKQVHRRFPLRNFCFK